MWKPPAAAPPLRHPLTYVRTAYGWTGQQLIDLLADRIPGLPRERVKVRGWESGTTPRMDVQLALAELLGLDRRAPLKRAWPDWLPVGDTHPVLAPWTAEGCLATLRATEGALMDRRAFLTTSAKGVAELALGWAIATHRERQTGDRDELLDNLESRLPLLRAREALLGGGAVRLMLHGEILQARALLEDFSADAGRQGRLLEHMSVLLQQAAWASLDSDYLAAAEKYFTAGLHCAQIAGDRAVGANILKTHSLLYLDQGQEAQALVLIERARAGASSTHPQVRAMLATRQARVHAAMRNSAACNTLLGEASRLMERADGDPPLWSAYFDDAEFAAQTAACHLALGLPALAEERLEESLTVGSGRRPRDEDTYRLWRGAAAIQLNDIDGACEHLRAALPGIGQSGSVRNRLRALELYTQFKPYRRAQCLDGLDAEVRSLVA